MKLGITKFLPVTQLFVHEWMAVVLLCFMAVVLAMTAQVNSEVAITMDVMDGYLQADIEGAVRYPGSYRFKNGSRLEDLLNAGEPLPEADLKGIRKKTRLKDGTLLVVKEQPSIWIHVVGAVRETQPIQVPRGTRLVDLLGIVAFQKNADLEALKKRRLLKDGEIVTSNSREK